ncbi:hypothetical protein V8E55_007038 [Tylopilus felleus]
MDKDSPDHIDISIPHEFSSHGIRVVTATQRLLYRGIQQGRKHKTHSRRTVISLARTKYAVYDITGQTPTSDQIWRSVRDRDLPKPIRSFLWKCLHEGYKIGEYWERITNMEIRSKCHLCGELENMEHILLNCQESIATRIIWELARELWLHCEREWPEISYGTILGCNLLTFRSKSKISYGKSCLFTILVSESANLVWKLRCECIFKMHGDHTKFHSTEEIRNKWIFTINSRLKFDQLYTNRSIFGKKAIPIKTVLQTWSGTLLEEENLQDDWSQQSGVLVGIASRRLPGRNR